MTLRETPGRTFPLLRMQDSFRHFACSGSDSSIPSGVRIILKIRIRSNFLFKQSSYQRLRDSMSGKEVNGRSCRSNLERRSKGTRSTHFRYQRLRFWSSDRISGSRVRLLKRSKLTSSITISLQSEIKLFKESMKMKDFHWLMALSLTQSRLQKASSSLLTHTRPSTRNCSRIITSSGSQTCSSSLLPLEIDLYIFIKFTYFLI